MRKHYNPHGRSTTEVGVSGLLVDLANQAVLLLRESGCDRVLPVWLGKNEANAIVHELSERPPERPLAHNMLAAVVSALRAEVTRSVISDLVDGVFYSEVTLKTGPRRMATLDARPSDAIYLAVKFHAPIFVATHLLDEYGLSYGEEAGAGLTPAEALRDRILRISPEDFGSYRLT